MQDPNNTTPDFTKPFDNSILVGKKPVKTNSTTLAPTSKKLLPKEKLIKRPWYLYLAIACLVPLLYFVVDRLQFMYVSHTTFGTVIWVTMKNDRCGSKYSRYDCSKFMARIVFASTSTKKLGVISVPAGSVDGHAQSVRLANKHIGDKVAVRYDPSDLSRAYLDDAFDIWFTPIIVSVAPILLFFSSLRSSKTEEPAEEESTTPDA